MRITLLVAFSVIVVISLMAAPAGAITETQTFDSAALAMAAGWTEVESRTPPNDFGFSDTNNAEGAAAGEGGGSIPRTGANPHSYYADITVGGPQDLSMDLHATGKLKFQNIDADGEYYFGWFDAVRAGLPDSTEDYIGFRVFEDQGSGWRVRASIDGNTGSDMLVPDDTAIALDIVWDADGGDVAGDGKLTVTMTHGVTALVDSVQGSSSIVWDAFGLMANDGGPDGRLAVLWYDDLEYTVIPEPGTMTLLGMGLLGLVGFGWRRRS